MTESTQQWTARATAKVNLFLDITGRRPDGYHAIRTVMKSIALADTVSLRLRTDGRFTVTCSDASLPTDDRNLAIRAGLAMRAAFGGAIPGADFHIEKRIPTGAGLGGGSADAAAALRLLREASGLSAPDEALEEVAARVGSDAPFFVRGGTALATGRGEILQPIENRCHEGGIVLICPDATVSTREAYRWWDEEGMPRASGSCEAMMTALRAGQWMDVIENCANAFEQIVGRRVPAVHEARMVLMASGCAKAVLTGSGAAVFGLTATRAEAEFIARRMKGRYSICAAV